MFKKKGEEKRKRKTKKKGKKLGIYEFDANMKNGKIFPNGAVPFLRTPISYPITPPLLVCGGHGGRLTLEEFFSHTHVSSIVVPRGSREKGPTRTKNKNEGSLSNMYNNNADEGTNFEGAPDLEKVERESRISF